MIRITVLLLATAAVSFGGTVFTLNTTALESSAAGPFTLDFQFIDGSGFGDGNNTVTLSDFDFGGGSVDTTPAFVTGGVNVSTGPLGVTLTDSSFLNEVQFSLTPGSSLSFLFDSTSNPDTGAPDTFTFAIDDGSGLEISTTNPSGFDSFVEVDLPSDSSGASTTLSSSAPGASVTLSAPTSGPTSSVPEPSAFLPLAAAALWAVRRKSRQRS